MAKETIYRRGTTAEHATFIGRAGEVTVDTDKNVLVVHDGVTPGGFPTLTAVGLCLDGIKITGSIIETSSIDSTVIGANSPDEGTFTNMVAKTLTFNDPLFAGLQLNSLTTAERDALVSPQEGMTIYNEDNGQIQVYNGTMWTGPSGAGAFQEQIYIEGVDFTEDVTTILTMPVAAAADNEADVFVTYDGLNQLPDGWSISGTTITFDTAIPQGVQKVHIKVLA